MTVTKVGVFGWHIILHWSAGLSTSILTKSNWDILALTYVDTIAWWLLTWQDVDTTVGGIFNSMLDAIFDRVPIGKGHIYPSKSKLISRITWSLVKGQTDAEPRSFFWRIRLFKTRPYSHLTLSTLFGLHLSSSYKTPAIAKPDKILIYFAFLSFQKLVVAETICTEEHVSNDSPFCGNWLGRKCMNIWAPMTRLSIDAEFIT